MQRKLALIVAALAVFLAVGESWAVGGTTPTRKVRFYFTAKRSAPTSSASAYIGTQAGDLVRCYPASSDTAGKGIDAVYAGGEFRRHYVELDSSEVCNCFEVGGSPDSLIADLQHVAILGLGIALAESTVTGRALRDSLLTAGVLARVLKANTITEAKIAANAVTAQQLAAGAVTDAKVSSGLSLSKLASASASTNNLLAWNGSAWSPTGALSVSSLASSGSVTVDGSLTAGADSADVLVVRGIPRAPEACRCFTFTSGASSRAFTFPKAQAGWLFLAQFQDANGKTIQSVSRTATDEVTVRCGVSVTSDSKICIWAWKP